MISFSEATLSSHSKGPEEIISLIGSITWSDISGFWWQPETKISLTWPRYYKFEETGVILKK
jgi:hypothetical protein